MADNGEPKPEEKPSADIKLEAPAGYVTLIIAALITGVLVFFLGLARRRAAIERNKALVLQEELDKAKDQAKLDENQKVRDEAAKKILELQVKVDTSNERLEKLDEEHEAYVKKLKEVNSWDDLFKD